MAGTDGSLWWSTGAARDALADPAGLDRLLEVPLLVLDLRDDVAIDERAMSLRRAPCPVVAIVPAGTLSTALPVDLVLEEDSADAGLVADTVDGAAELLGAAAAAHPTAAAVLVDVLRVTATLPVSAALTIESLAYSLLLGGGDFRAWLAGRGPAPAARQRDPEIPVLTHREGDVLSVTLNRPQVHNAYDAAMRDALADALDVALLDPDITRVVLGGNGPSFCSGGDLGEFGTADDLVRAHVLRTTRSVAARLHALGDRVEARVHGHCIGAGVELAAFAGRVVATGDATFLLPEVGMGLTPGAGGTVSLPRRIGAGRTFLLALSGLALSAQDALRWGLVDALDPA